MDTAEKEKREQELRTKTFLENYDKGNKALEELLKSRLSGIVNETVTGTDNGSLAIKQSIEKVKALLSETTRPPVDRALEIGSVLGSISSVMYKDAGEQAKRLWKFLLISFVDIADASLDSRLISSSRQIMTNLKGG